MKKKGTSGELIRTQIAGPHPQSSWFSKLRIYIFKKSLIDIDDPSPETILWEPLD